jgi:hypothetical protein
MTEKPTVVDNAVDRRQMTSMVYADRVAARSSDKHSATPWESLMAEASPSRALPAKPINPVK